MRHKPDGDAVGDMTQSDWERASDDQLNGEFSPVAIAADKLSGKISEDEAHEMVLSWLSGR